MTVSIHTVNGIQALSEDAFVERLESMRKPFASPFSSEGLDLLAALSKTLLRHSEASQFPQILALGYWLRPSALKRLGDLHLHTSPSLRTVPRGLAFHLPPSNVDTLFVYSWALSVLSGNSNIVRLPSELSAATLLLVDVLCHAVDAQGMASSQLFCSYDKSQSIGQYISSRSDLRIIWGGDEKVLSLSREPIMPDGLSIGFPDRTSLCVVSDSGFRKLSADARSEAVRGLYNDIFWFDQLGCGSPRAICWLGGGSMADELYSLLSDVILEKGLKVETGTAISKFVFINELIAEGKGRKLKIRSNELSIVESDVKPGMLDNLHGGGLLLHCVLQDTHEIIPLFSRKLQTITHIGLSIEEIDDVADLMEGTGGLRLVPAGDALSFGPVWDGYDLLNSFTRKVVVDYGARRS